MKIEPKPDGPIPTSNHSKENKRNRFVITLDGASHDFTIDRDPLLILVEFQSYPEMGLD